MTWPGKARTTGRGTPKILNGAVVPSEALWEFAGENGEPDVFARFEIRDDRPECTEMRILAKPGGRGLRTSDLGVWQLDNFAINVFASVSEKLRVAPDGNTASSSRSRDESEEWAVLGALTEARTRHRRGPSSIELQRVADVYRNHFDSGAPVKAVAAALGYADRTAARRVEQAREAGLLPRTSKGKPKI